MNCRLLTLMLVLLCPISAYAAETTLDFGRFGKVALYQSVSQPSQVVLFVSGDGGWNLGVVDMARELSNLHNLVGSSRKSVQGSGHG